MGGEARRNMRNAARDRQINAGRKAANALKKGFFASLFGGSGYEEKEEYVEFVIY